MQKKLTVLFAFAFFVLLVGWAVTPVQAHDCDNHNRTDHALATPHCPIPIPNQSSSLASRTCALPMWASMELHL